MSSAMLLDRGAFGAAPLGAATQSQAGAAGAATGFCVVPRCEMTVEKCAGGLKIQCRCEDDLSCATLQNLCKTLAGGLCSCCCTLNGATLCQCNLACGFCKCEDTADGCCITCTSGDAACCAILQACCDALACCLKNGCCCYLCFNNTPVCCGCCA